jgi:FKBP-type peptidyl-prolyl cis-trans isomerase FklB
MTLSEPGNSTFRTTLQQFFGIAACAGMMMVSAALPATARAAEPAPPVFDTDAKKASYSIGYSMAQNIRREFGKDIDVAAFQAGIQDQLTGNASQVSDEDANTAFQSMIAARQAAAEVVAQEALVEGQAFLAENGKRDGVVTLPSGLQYEVIVAADGPKPTAEDRVTTHYRGTLIDGTQFDSSYDRGQPATFPLNGVISGWTEALQLMSPGAKWRLYIPPDLAYGDRAQGPIPANSTLIFDVELLEIN